jgi:D-alanyl-lipoteichoic acid acyltransferase DltB (MBOAT superfamily)
MLLGGIWHGAGLTFVVWGALHAIFIVLNHAWRDFVVARHPGIDKGIGYQVPAYALTMVCVVIGWVFFRATTVHGALNMLTSLWPSFAALPSILPNLAQHWLLLLVAVILVTAFPNSRQIHDRMLALGSKGNWVWLGYACGATTALSLIFISAESTFLYFQF